jgi:hypothetical protein
MNLNSTNKFKSISALMILTVFIDSYTGSVSKIKKGVME